MCQLVDQLVCQLSYVLCHEVIGLDTGYLRPGQPDLLLVITVPYLVCELMRSYYLCFSKTWFEKGLSTVIILVAAIIVVPKWWTELFIPTIGGSGAEDSS